MIKATEIGRYILQEYPEWKIVTMNWLMAIFEVPGRATVKIWRELSNRPVVWTVEVGMSKKLDGGAVTIHATKHFNSQGASPRDLAMEIMVWVSIVLSEFSDIPRHISPTSEGGESHE